jgi:hypothetical protein
MLYRIAVALLLIWAVPVVDASAQGKGKGSGVNCHAVAKSQCASYGRGAQACYRSAFGRCRQGAR